MFGMEVTPTRHPGVFKRPDGRYLVRARVKDPKTGKEISITENIEARDADAALRHLIERKQAIRAGGQRTKLRTRFASFAVGVAKGRKRVKSAATRDRYSNIVTHLTTDGFPVTYAVGDARQHTVTRTFGIMFLDEIGRTEIRAYEEWLQSQVDADEIVAPTANDRLRFLRLILREALDEKHIDAVPKIELLDESTHDPWPDDDPNALDPEMVPRFLAKIRELFPQHYAMAVMQFTFGLRPSMLRPLRRDRDVDWITGKLYLRRSWVKGPTPMEKIKTTKKDILVLPPEVLAVLRWHLDRMTTARMRDSELLFPSEKGGFRARSVLDKPFRKVCAALGIKKRLTPGIGPRRTSKDLMRRIDIDPVVAMAISTHKTPEMHAHYSSPGLDEKRVAGAKLANAVGVEALGNVIPFRRESPIPAPPVAQPRTRKRYCFEGAERTHKECAALSGINASTLLYRLGKGMTIEQAIALGTGGHGRPLVETVSGEIAGERTREAV